VRVLVTGATGFAGTWLMRDLEAAGHDAVGMPPSSTLDITDDGAVDAFVAGVRPDAIAHLAAISFGPDARRDPGRALAVNEGGTRAVLSAAVRHGGMPVLVASSSDVYGAPLPGDLPLSETAPLRANQPYALSKIGSERAALKASRDIPVAVVRPFNHTGPGQRPEFVVPALATRIALAALHGDDSIRAGNIDVRRDFSDVRDVVRAYRQILEGLVNGGLPASHRLYNVASGRAVAIREIVSALAALAGIDVRIEIDPTLVRSDDPSEIRGDASLIATDLGWTTAIPLEATLRDVMDETRSRPGLDVNAATALSITRRNPRP
jgi:GDP-4-dehydro-6-deoxy-D-mannose reductase